MDNIELDNLQNYRLEIIKKLDEKGYKYRELMINDEEYLIITNGVSSCAIQIDRDICSLYEIVYDFRMDGYFLMYRNFYDIEKIFTGINFLLREVDEDSLKRRYGLKDVKNKKLKVIKKTLINNGFIVYVLINNEEHILLSKDNKKWIAINYKNNEYIYSFIYICYE